MVEPLSAEEHPGGPLSRAERVLLASIKRQAFMARKQLAGLMHVTGAIPGNQKIETAHRAALAALDSFMESCKRRKEGAPWPAHQTPRIAPKAPPALPAELSGKGEQRRPTIEELEAILREPDGTYEVHILPNGEVHSRRILKAVEPEPGEAKKEEGT